MVRRFYHDYMIKLQLAHHTWAVPATCIVREEKEEEQSGFLSELDKDW